MGAAYAGVAGALAALLLDFIAPESFTYWLSILFLVGSVFGGMTSVWGAVAGGLLLQFWPDIAGMVSRDLVHPVFGALLVLAMRFMPNGVAGMVSAWECLATWAMRAVHPRKPVDVSVLGDGARFGRRHVRTPRRPRQQTGEHCREGAGDNRPHDPRRPRHDDQDFEVRATPDAASAR